MKIIPIEETSKFYLCKIIVDGNIYECKFVKREEQNGCFLAECKKRQLNDIVWKMEWNFNLVNDSLSELALAKRNSKRIIRFQMQDAKVYEDDLMLDKRWFDWDHFLYSAVHNGLPTISLLSQEDLKISTYFGINKLFYNIKNYIYIPSEISLNESDPTDNDVLEIFYLNSLGLDVIQSFNNIDTKNANQKLNKRARVKGDN